MNISIRTFNAKTAETNTRDGRTTVNMSGAPEDISFNVHRASEDDTRAMLDQHEWEVRSYEGSYWIVFTILGMQANVFVSPAFAESITEQAVA